MNKIESVKKNVKKVIDNHERYDFPEFIYSLRACLCIPNAVIARDLDLPKLKMFYAERGRFVKRLSQEFILQLADYFGVDSKVMVKKLEEYVSKKALKNVGVEYV